MNRDLIALVMLGGLLWMKFGDGSAPSLPAGPEVSELRSTGLSKTDALKISAYIDAYGDLVYEDGQREKPYIKSMAALKSRMHAIGDLTVGPGAAIETRYPSLPEILAKHIAVEAPNRRGDLDGPTRAEFKGRCDALVQLLKRV
jgi:hypothetical protein